MIHYFVSKLKSHTTRVVSTIYLTSPKAASMQSKQIIFFYGVLLTYDCDLDDDENDYSFEIQARLPMKNHHID